MTFAELNCPFSLDLVDEVADVLLPEIKKAGYIAGGVLPSEMLAFVAFAKMQMCDLIFESGRHLGFSTRVLGKFFDVVSVDCAPISSVDDDIRANYPRVDIKVGQCDRVLKKHVKNWQNRRVAMLLDGPKGMTAYRIIKNYSHAITFGAIHDVSKLVETPGGAQIHQARVEMEQIEPPVLFTDDETYVSKYGELDSAAFYTGYSCREELVARGFTLAMVKGDRWA